MSIQKNLLPLIAITLFSGCIGIEETMTLQSDGSGTVHMKVEFAEGGVRWLPGKPDVDWLRPGLPEGVRMTSFVNRQKQKTVTDKKGKQHDLVFEVFEFDLEFDNVNLLNEVRVRPDSRNAMAAAAGGTPGKEPVANETSPSSTSQNAGPFQEVSLVREGNLIRFRRIVQAARDSDDIDASMMGSPGSAMQPKAFDLADSKLVIAIACPGEVVEHNAGQVRGRQLIWEFDLQELQENQDKEWAVTFVCRLEGEQ